MTLVAHSQAPYDTRLALSISDPPRVVSSGRPRNPKKPLEKRIFLNRGHRARISQHV